MEDINKSKVYRVGLVLYEEEELFNIINNAKKDDRTKEIIYIKHDKDTDEIGNIKKEHFHLLLNFSRGPITLNTVKQRILGIEQERYVKILSKSWQKNLQYLIHKNNSNKHKYSLDEIHIEKGNPEEVINLIISDKPVNTNRYFDELKELIMSRKINNENEVEVWTIENFGSSELYLDNFKKISSYLKAIHESDKFSDLNKSLSGVVYIQGFSGVGKSSYARQLCQDFNNKFNFSGIFEGSAGSSDFLDGYNNQSSVILNDIRADLIGSVGVSNILNLMDWHNGTLIHSRYKNIDISNIKLIIFTSTQSLETVFKTFNNEEQKQFFRRIKTKVVMDDNFINIYNYDEDKNRYFEYKKNRNIYNRNYMEKRHGITKNLILDLI